MIKRNPNRMLIPEYKRRVFNEAVLTCMDKIHGMILNGDVTDVDPMDAERFKTMASSMCRTFFDSELKLSESTISQTKARLSESITFIKDCVNVSEAIAEQKACDAAEKDCEMDNDQKIELSDEDEALIDKLFDEKGPEMQVEQIRDATVQALVAEDQKAQEIKDSMNIANSQVAAGSDPAVLKETVERLEKRGPTSLMNAIINNVTTAAIRDVNEHAKGGVGSIAKVMQENADEIKTRAVMIYTLYETSNVMGIRKRTPTEVKRLAEEIYYGK